jgi:predicted phage tail protein
VPGEAVNEFAVPINTAPVRTTTYTDTPSYGEHEYRVTAVAVEGPPLLQSNASAPVSVAFRDLVAPPAPASVTALIETKIVRLLWDPVEASDLAGYHVYRSEGMGHNTDIKEIGTFLLVSELVTATTISDANANLGIAYRYAVTAVDKSGNESPRTWTEWVVAPKTP